MEIIEGANRQSLSQQSKSQEKGGELKTILQQTGWNKAKTARLMGISRPTLYRLIQQHGLKPPVEKV